MAISKKANLLKKANELEIPTFGNPSVAELERRLNDWRPGKGWVVRRLYQKALPEWAGDNIPHKSTLWLPNTSFSHKLMRTGKLVFIGRTAAPPLGSIVVEEDE